MPKKASYEVHFRCLIDEELFFRYETDKADGFVPRTGELVYLPRKEGPQELYRGKQVTTVIHRLPVYETYPVTNCYLGSVICDVERVELDEASVFSMEPLSKYIS